MNTTSPNYRGAGRLLYKALQTTLAPANDLEYRDLLAQFRADPLFAQQVSEFAQGMELAILDVSERGLIVVPTSRDSKFAVRLTDIRSGLDIQQKASLVLAHVAIAATFFPTTDGLEDDNYIPPPGSVANFRDSLHALAKQLEALDGEQLSDIPSELAPGWRCITALMVSVPSSQRATINSVVGFIRLALKNMREAGLVRIDRDSEEDDTETYTPTQRMRVQLRELALRRLFDLAQTAALNRNA
ncbi:MAG: hypothetical protein HHJ17_02540 [Rhodoferax sp.]|uniref:hypothetical protein n=1 Tax=Rhodoferax sp. TaxID=50421 RepID=UPI001839FDE4|nr:hypothetical protein [Rhodoferax sp.]NMM12409.1 hypothetical protein [Rhodoferax sp.]NMM18724.1 hypothetical protein [Rhodoferax sp.]